MHIVAIGWLFVTTLMALTEPNFVAGALTWVFYGLLPIWLLLWLTGAFARRSGRRRWKSRPGAEPTDGSD